MDCTISGVFMCVRVKVTVNKWDKIVTSSRIDKMLQQTDWENIDFKFTGMQNSEKNLREKPPKTPTKYWILETESVWRLWVECMNWAWE